MFIRVETRKKNLIHTLFFKNVTLSCPDTYARRKTKVEIAKTWQVLLSKMKWFILWRCLRNRFPTLRQLYLMIRLLNSIICKSYDFCPPMIFEWLSNGTAMFSFEFESLKIWNYIFLLTNTIELEEKQLEKMLDKQFSCDGHQCLGVHPW